MVYVYPSKQRRTFAHIKLDDIVNVLQTPKITSTTYYKFLHCVRFLSDSEPEKCQSIFCFPRVFRTFHSINGLKRAEQTDWPNTPGWTPNKHYGRNVFIWNSVICSAVLVSIFPAYLPRWTTSSAKFSYRRSLNQPTVGLPPENDESKHDDTSCTGSFILATPLHFEHPGDQRADWRGFSAKTTRQYWQNNGYWYPFFECRAHLGHEPSKVCFSGACPAFGVVQPERMSIYDL